MQRACVVCGICVVSELSGVDSEHTNGFYIMHTRAYTHTHQDEDTATTLHYNQEENRTEIKRLKVETLTDAVVALVFTKTEEVTSRSNDDRVISDFETNIQHMFNVSSAVLTHLKHEPSTHNNKAGNSTREHGPSPEILSEIKH
jgi:hypothetical protein